MISVIIEREIAEGLEEYYEKAISELLDAMTASPGYVSGESLVEIHRPNRYHVITQWTNEDSWKRWFNSGERQQLLSELRPFLQTDEKFTLLKQLAYHQQ